MAVNPRVPIRRGRRGFELTLNGVDQLTQNLARMAKNASQNMKDAKKEVDGEILELAQTRTPKDTHALVETGRLVEEDRGRFFQTSITFGGPAKIGKNTPFGFVDYAVEVHERTEVFHKNGQAKFLESAVNEFAPHYSRLIAKKAGNIFD